MMNRTNRFVPVLLAILYGTLALVSVPFHFHDEASIAFGSGAPSFSVHADADHCSHRSADVHHDDCTLCSVVAHEQTAPFTGTAQFADAVESGRSTADPFLPVPPFHTVLSRRGPPAVLA